MATVGHRIQLLLRQWVDLNSLQVRLTAGIVLASLVAIAGLTGWLGWRTQAILLNSHFHRASLIMDRFAEDVAYYVDPMQMPVVEALQKVIDHRTTGDLAIWVTTAEGDPIAQSDTLTMGSWQESGVADDLLQMAINDGTAIQSVQTWMFVVCAKPLALTEFPDATVHLANDITADYQGLQQLVRMLWLTGLAMVTLLALVCAGYIRRALRPIRQINRLASQVTAETLGYHRLVLPTAPTEIAELVQTYNLMLTRLAKAWAQQKQFINDVSHELRTPLTLVQGYLESTLRRANSLPAPQRQGLEIAVAETHRTIHLLTELLELARIENHQRPLALAPANLVDLVAAAIASVEAAEAPLPDHPHISLESPAVAPVVRIDQAKLSTVLVTLLNYARRSGSPDHGIQVTILTQPNWVLVQIHGPQSSSLNPEQSLVFDPPIEGNGDDPNRSTALELTLARSLIEAMAGQLSVRSQPAQGCVFTIALPHCPT